MNRELKPLERALVLDKHRHFFANFEDGLLPETEVGSCIHCGKTKVRRKS